MKPFFFISAVASAVFFVYDIIIEQKEKHKDILSFRDLAVGTVATYTSYMTTYIAWVEENLPGRELYSVTWEEIRSYVRYLKQIKGLNPRTVNVHISQLRDFYYYVLRKDWDRREVPFLQYLPL